MKVVFDTNVYVAEALLGENAEQIIAATIQSSWRIFVSDYLLDETVRVLTEHFGCSIRFASLTKRRIARRSVFVEPRISRHQVPNDPDDSPIPAAALEAGADYLVSNDRHLLDLNPYEGLRIVSMSEYRAILIAEGFLRDI